MALNEFKVYPNPPNCRFSMACSTPKIHAEKLNIWKYYNWLVVFRHPSENHEFVSWDYDIPKPPTR